MRKKNIIKSSIAILSILLILFSGISIYGAEAKTEKSEIVYVNLDTYGKVSLINVYNSYLVKNQEKIIDYGKYESIENLVNKDNPIKQNDYIEWNVSNLNRFAYMGKISNERQINIPWNIDISYKLNGESVNADELVGKEGLVKITVDVKPNINANEFFKNNYILEITSDFDMDKYISVYSKDATEALVGKTKTLMFVILPGQEKSIDIEIGSNNFEMNGLTFAMVPLQGEIFDKILELTKNKDEMEDALDSLNSSLDIVLNNLQGMGGGINSLIDGTTKLKNGGDEIYNLSGERNENISNARNDLNELSKIGDKTNQDIDNLKNAVNNINEMLEKSNKKMKDFSKDLNSISKDLNDLSIKSKKIPKDLDKISNTIYDTKKLVGEAEKLVKTQINASNYDTTSLLQSLNNIKTNTESIGNVASEEYQEAVSIGDMQTAMKYGQIASNAQEIGNNLLTTKSELEEIQTMMDSGIKATKNIANYIGNLENDLDILENITDRLSNDTEDISDKIDLLEVTINDLKDLLDISNEYVDKYLSNKNNVDVALDNTKELVNKIQKLENTGDKMIENIQNTLTIVDNQIYNGANNLSDGALNVLNNTRNIISQSNNIRNSKDIIRNIIKDRMNELEDKTNIFKIDTNAKKVSFVDERNDSPISVQILLKSADIKEKTAEEENDLEPQPNKTTIWQRIKDLFIIIVEWFKNLFK